MDEVVVQLLVLAEGGVGDWVGGREKMKLMFNSTLANIEVEVRVELGKTMKVQNGSENVVLKNVGSDKKVCSKKFFCP